jgi:hypothetical protein
MDTAAIDIPNRPLVLHAADVFVDKSSPVYCTDFSVGLYILEFLRWTGRRSDNLSGRKAPPTLGPRIKRRAPGLPVTATTKTETQ